MSPVFRLIHYYTMVHSKKKPKNAGKYKVDFISWINKSIKNACGPIKDTAGAAFFILIQKIVLR